MTDRRRRVSAIPGVGILALGVTLGACSGGAETDAGRVSVRDSAGIRIVTSSVDGLPRRTVASEPRFAVGSLDGPDALFRVTAAHPLDDGSWLLANVGTRELRVFGPSGDERYAFGGEGEGPGEFQSLGVVERFAPDSLLVWDIMSRRVSILSTSGELSRDFNVSFQNADGAANPIAAAAPDRWLALRRRLMDGPPDAGLRQGEVRYALMGGDGTLIRDLAILPAESSWVVVGDGFFSFRPVPVTSSSPADAGGGRIYLGFNGDPRIEVRDQEGRLVEIRELLLEPIPVTEDRWNALMNRQLALTDDPEARTAIRDFYDAVPRPDSYPAWGTLLAGADGTLWVSQYREPFSEGPQLWWRFDTDGAVAEEVALPADFTPLWASRDQIAGIMKDELEVEYFHVYGLAEDEAGR